MAQHRPLPRRTLRRRGRRSQSTQCLLLRRHRGGVFKTADGGVTWEAVSDGQGFGTGTVGAIAVADSDPNLFM